MFREMRSFLVSAVGVLWIFCASHGIFAQQPVKSQEVSDADGLPVLVKHLPFGESVKGQTQFFQNTADLRSSLGNRPELDVADLIPGAEAVTAPYNAGRLLIIEYPTPQASVDADARFAHRLAEIGAGERTLYRRIGNYSAFVFDVTDPAAANALLDEVKYEKTVQWLGEDPTLLQRAERAFILTTPNIFFSTVTVILLGMGASIVGGIIAGIFFYYFRDQKRAGMEAFSDAGGMTRLNLDHLTPDVSSERLLNENTFTARH
jgi:hypothetical protein